MELAVHIPAYGVWLLLGLLSVSSLRRQLPLLVPRTPPSCGRCDDFSVIDQWRGCGLTATTRHL